MKTLTLFSLNHFDCAIKDPPLEYPSKLLFKVRLAGEGGAHRGLRHDGRCMRRTRAIGKVAGDERVLTGAGGGWVTRPLNRMP
jgi:hypothetical protein